MSGTGQQPATEHDTTHRSSDHDHHAPTDTPDGQDDTATEHADAHTIPRPRQSTAAKPPQRPSQRPGAAPVTNPVPATLTAGPDGALWVTVNGADVQQLANRINAVCDVLNSDKDDHPL